MSTPTSVACPTCASPVPTGLAACPVCQQAIAPPAALALTVKPGDDLAAVLAAAPPGATITLEAGDYDVSTSLVVATALTIQGAGRDVTRIRSTALGSVLRFVGDGERVLRGLHLLHVGEPWAHVMVIEGGPFTLQGCRFEDGKPMEALQDMGDGLRVSGEATGTVTRCEFLGNGADGVAIGGAAQVTLEDNLCRGNRQSGIAYMERAAGLARGNRCEGNAKNGIAVFHEAQPRLEGNQLRDNGLSGIRYSDRAGGEAIANHAEGNRNGLSLDDAAAPALRGNVLVANRECGLQFTGETTAIASANRCENNGWDGVFVGGTAAPSLSKHHLADNRRNGLAYFDQSRGRAQDNTITRNGCDGVALFQTAAPVLEGNTVERNGWNGIVYFDEAQGRAAGNLCQHNQGCGLVVSGRARPDLVANTLARNGEYGLAYREQAAGAADHQVIAENALGDLHKDKGAKPAIGKGKARKGLATAPPDVSPLTTGDARLQLTPQDDLAQAIQAAPAGATIELAAGVYRLTSRLDLDQGLTIVGAGREATRIVGADEGFVMRYFGRGTLVLRGVHLAHGGDRWAHGLMADGPVELRDCRFTGASRDMVSQLGGCGVWLCAQATGRVAGCEFSGNVYGLAVQGHEPLHLEGNRCEANEVGMAFLERTTAVATANHCTQNRVGMLVEAEARPELLENRLIQNVKHGLVYQGQAAGAARRNEMALNGGDGVVVREEAAPLLERNRMVQNRGRCLRYSGTRGGRAIDNHCESSEAGAIVVGRSAAPTLGPRQGEVTRGEVELPPVRKAPSAHLVVRLKPGADLAQAVLNAATGTEIQLEPGIYRTQKTITVQKSLTLRGVGTGAVQVVSTAQKAALRVAGAPRFAMHGLWIERDTPRYGEVAIVGAGEIEIRGCRFSGGRNDTNHGLGGDGLRIVGETTGTVEGCEFKGNQGFGIAVCEQARPMLVANQIHHNGQGGIGYVQQAAGTAERNRCVSNQGAGIAVGDQATPTIQNNESLSNERSGIAYTDASGGAATRNRCGTNHEHGIVLTDRARPEIQGNVCEGNGGLGIAVWEPHRLRLGDNVERDNRGEA